MVCAHIYVPYKYNFDLSLGDFLDGMCLAVGKERLTELLVIIIITVYLAQEAVLLGTAGGGVRGHKKY